MPLGLLQLKLSEGGEGDVEVAVQVCPTQCHLTL